MPVATDEWRARSRRSAEHSSSNKPSDAGTRRRHPDPAPGSADEACAHPHHPAECPLIVSLTKNTDTPAGII